MYKIDGNNKNCIIVSKIQIPVYLHFVELFGAYGYSGTMQQHFTTKINNVVEL